MPVRSPLLRDKDHYVDSPRSHVRPGGRGQVADIATNWRETVGASSPLLDYPPRWNATLLLRYQPEHPVGEGLARLAL